MDVPNVGRLKLPDANGHQIGGSRYKARFRKFTHLFLKGPVPLLWLQQAAQLPGQCLSVGIAVWFLAGVQRTENGLAVTNALVSRFGVSRHAKNRALGHLERAGLISVLRQGRQSARVSIIQGTRG